MELKTIKDEFERVSKKQKLCYSKMKEVVDGMSQEIKKALSTMQEAPAGPDNHESVIVDLKRTLQEIAPSSQLEATQREVNLAVTKYLKAVDKTLNPEISNAYINIEFDSRTVHQIVAHFFYRQGMYDTGDCFNSETGEPESSARKSFFELSQILEAMESRDLGPAFNWAASNSDQLKQANSDLEMKLHSLRFLEIAQGKNSSEAVNYARKHIAPYFDSCFPEIQKLMTSLLWSRKLKTSPYAEFLSPALWTGAAKELTRQYCNLLGESKENLLSVTIAAGSQVLPQLLKYLNVMPNKRQEWQTMEQLLVPVKLLEEYQFHSVFVCPVSKEHSTEANPPMRMGCGHVICKQSISSMLRNGSQTFKCPYCPSEIDASQCRQLYL